MAALALLRSHAPMDSRTLMKLYCQTLETPVGSIRLLGREDALLRLDFHHGPKTPAEAEEKPGFGGFSERLSAYFRGDLSALDPIATDPQGTPFQKEVWKLLRQIPPGRTASYGELASQLGRPHSSRAVGMANARNPVSLVVPCHRVIGADGGLTGYAGGLERKRWLLAHEGVLLA